MKKTHNTPDRSAAESSARLVALVTLALLSGCQDPPPPEPVPPPEPPAPTTQTKVVRVDGRVEKQVAGADWQPVAVGDTLDEDESVRTGPNASADLQVGEDSTIGLNPDTHVTVDEVTAAVQELKLRKGRLSVDHKPGGKRILRIKDGSGEVALETSGAKFNVADTGKSFAVATLTGSVDLSSANETVTVDAGKQSLARSGEAPSAATAVPMALLLKVARAARARDAKLCTVIRGTATPGAEVTVADRAVAVAADGSFSEAVQRRAGLEAVAVTIRDAAGRMKTETVKCDPVPKPSPPADKINDLKINWGNPAEN